MIVTLRVLLGAAEALSLNSLALCAGVALGPLIGQGLLREGGLAWAGAAALAVLAVALAGRVPETRV